MSKRKWNDKRFPDRCFAVVRVCQCCSKDPVFNGGEYRWGTVDLAAENTLKDALESLKKCVFENQTQAFIVEMVPRRIVKRFKFTTTRQTVTQDVRKMVEA